jgi:VWFA-related protein
MNGGHRRGAFIIAAMLTTAAVSARQNPIATFTARAERVLVPVSVSQRNRPVVDLKPSEFLVTDNGVRQDVTVTSIDALPVDVTLVLDRSGSVQGDALTRFTADMQTIAESLDVNDRLRLITFAVEVTDAFGLQSGGAALPLNHVESGGATSFYNAVAAALMLAPQSDRPSLIFSLSDGFDNTSFLDPTDLVSLAGHSSAALYIGLATNPAGDPPNLRVLRQAAERTGGAVYSKAPGASIADTFARVLAEFRMSYLVSYTPTGVKRDGWHQIKVDVTGGPYTIRARQGYEGG